MVPNRALAKGKCELAFAGKKVNRGGRTRLCCALWVLEEEAWGNGDGERRSQGEAELFQWRIRGELIWPCPVPLSSRKERKPECENAKPVRATEKRRRLGDRISALPDEIIHTIIPSLDDTQQAARTSTLSRRWLHLWRSYPVLEFRGGDERSKASAAEYRKFARLAVASSRRLSLYHKNFRYGVGFVQTVADELPRILSPVREKSLRQVARQGAGGPEADRRSRSWSGPDGHSGFRQDCWPIAAGRKFSGSKAGEISTTSSPSCHLSRFCRCFPWFGRLASALCLKTFSLKDLKLSAPVELRQSHLNLISSLPFLESLSLQFIRCSSSSSSTETSKIRIWSHRLRVLQLECRERKVQELEIDAPNLVSAYCSRDKLWFPGKIAVVNASSDWRFVVARHDAESHSRTRLTQ
ncbi:unnamed protein product [Linum tenue]|uniref:F-box domain-containing protein n=1 Tax=Linum tenue TaxID=586396 RepID=A0AAV0IMQ2_9ROSI|nr:unnamed protein product [Linum tenue]